MTDAAIANLVHAVHAARSDAKAARAALADATSDGAAIAALTAERIADTAVDHLANVLTAVVGARFAELLRAEVGDETFATIVRRNSTAAHAYSCASHDFIDANDVMQAAWDSIGIPAAEAMNIDSTWDDAWAAFRSAARMR